MASWNDLDRDATSVRATWNRSDYILINTHLRLVPEDTMAVTNDPPHGLHIAPFPGGNGCRIELSKRIMFAVFRNGSRLPGVVSFLLGYIKFEINAVLASDGQSTSVKQALWWERKRLGWRPGALAKIANWQKFFAIQAIRRFRTVLVL